MPLDALPVTTRPPLGAARKGRDAGLDLACVAHADGAQLAPERWRRGLNCGELAGPGGCAGFPNDRGPFHAGRDLFEQLQAISRSCCTRTR